MIDGFQGVAEIQGETGREVHSFEDLKTWLESRKESQKVSISRTTLKDCTPWFYDEDSGQIRNPKRSFFQIAGIHSSFSDGRTIEQPIILQFRLPGYIPVFQTEGRSNSPSFFKMRSVFWGLSAKKSMESGTF